jgi:hypothetical protein
MQLLMETYTSGDEVLMGTNLETPQLQHGAAQTNQEMAILP